MTIENPTNKDVSIVILGRALTVPANGALAGLSVDEVVTWKRTHGFLKITEDVVAVKSRDYPKETILPEIKEEIKEVPMVKKSIFSKPVKK